MGCGQSRPSRATGVPGLCPSASLDRGFGRSAAFDACLARLNRYAEMRVENPRVITLQRAFDCRTIQDVPRGDRATWELLAAPIGVGSRAPLRRCPLSPAEVRRPPLPGNLPAPDSKRARRGPCSATISTTPGARLRWGPALLGFDGNSLRPRRTSSRIIVPPRLQPMERSIFRARRA